MDSNEHCSGGDQDEPQELDRESQGQVLSSDNGDDRVD